MLNLQKKIGLRHSLGPLPPSSGVSALPTTYLPTLSIQYAGVWSLTKLVSGYSGALAAACSVSDNNATPSTSVDIPAKTNGQPDYSAAITAFGSRFAIWKVYEQKGTGYHAVQTTPGFRPVVNTSLILAAGFYPPSDGAGAAGSSEAYLTFPTLSTTRRASTMLAVLSGVNGGEGSAYNSVMALGNVDVDTGASMLLAAYTSVEGGLGVRSSTEQRTALMVDSIVPTVAAIVFGVASTKVWRGSESATLGAASDTTMPGGQLGTGLFNLSGRGVRTHANIVFQSALSDADYALLNTALNTIFTASAKSKQIINDGDSIDQGEGSTDTQNKNYFMRSFTAPAYTFNVGQGGQSLQALAINRDASWFAARYRSDFSKNVYGNNAGINDINGGRTDTQVNADMATLISTAKTAGLDVVIETLLPFGFSGAKETYRLAVNAYRVANATALGYRLVNYNDNPLITYDGTNHPDTNGYAVMGTIAGPVYASAIS